MYICITNEVGSANEAHAYMGKSHNFIYFHLEILNAHDTPLYVSGWK